MDSTRLDEIHALANSLRRAYNRLRHTADRLHADSGLTAPKRTLMMDLHRYGPQTVPQLAASRFISRQIIQTQVNELVAAGLLKTRANPRHKRSRLVELSAGGRKLLGRMIARETAYLEALDWYPKPRELAACRKVLDEIHQRLEL